MQNVFKSTCRNFTRKPTTNLINLVGLSVSLTLVIILSIYSYSELTTDNYHKNGDRLFLYADLSGRMYMPAILKDQIDLNIPEIESSVRLAGAWEAPVFQFSDREPITSDIVFADTDFFKLFTYQPVEGNLETSLIDPMSVVISKTLAEKLFGKEHAIGKTIKMNNDKELNVTAVFNEPKANTCLSFNAITSVATRKIVQPNGEEFTNWDWSNFQLFVLLKEGAKADETAKKIASLFPKHNQDPEDFSKLKLNPFKKVYFTSFALYGSDSTYLHGKDKNKVLILMLVSALVLMIALVNFINISSSQWMEKIRQTGVMKVIGARKSAIVNQILSEAFLQFLFALVLAFMIVLIVSPFIKNNTGIQFNQHILYSPSFLLFSITGISLLSITFSIIPALRISSSKTVDNLKKSIEPGSTKSIVRGILVTSQFVIAIVLIAFTLLIQKQVNFGSSNLGFNQSNVIGIKLTQQLNEKKDVLKKILQDKPSVEKISFTQYYPGKPISHWATNQKINGENKQYNFDTFNSDANFFGILGLQLVQGRFFSNDLATDQQTIIVNETFVRDNKMDNPVGSKLLIGMEGKPSEIIGVVKDFHYKAVNEPIVPLLIQNESYASYCLLRIQTTDFGTLYKTIEDLKAAATKLSPSFPVEISFLDQAIENLYQSELQFRRTFSLFSICAIVICCLGILAMSLFASHRRIKEIGIRKVNGANVSEILAMLNKDFVKWVAIAFLIATPIAYYAMNRWLESFAYKTSLSWWIFALAGLLALGIAIITVSWQSWRAAKRNPVEALRYE